MKPTDSQESHETHLLTHEDVEELLLAADALYWRILEVSRKRTLNLRFDPYQLNRRLNLHKPPATPLK